MDLDAWSFVEKEQLLPTKESLHQMTNSQWMVEHLIGDPAVQLSVYRDGFVFDLDRERINRLATVLGFAFDWQLLSKPDTVASPWSWKPPMTHMQAQAVSLLDRYSMRATRYVLDKDRSFAEQRGRNY